MKSKMAGLTVLGWVLAMGSAGAMDYGPFGALGYGGTRHGQEFRVGAGGQVYELEGFLYVGGMDLNGEERGVAGRLSRGELPGGLRVTFASERQEGGVLLRYRWENQGEGAFNEVRFFVLVDVEIDERENTFFNERGRREGVAGLGALDGAADYWQVDEPGFGGGTLYERLLEGTLENRDKVGEEGKEDVGLGLGFALGTLKAGEAREVRVLIAEDGRQLGAMGLKQWDPESAVGTEVMLSGEADVPAVTVSEVTSLVRLEFEWRLNQPVGSLVGRLRVENLAESTVGLGAPFQLGLESTSQLYYVRPSGRLGDGMPYLDLSEAVGAKLGVGGVLRPGEAVVVEGVEVFSAGRVAPPGRVWRMWATRVP